jgi:O-antigen ligase
VVLALTRDRPRALRLVVYVMAGTLAGMSLGFLEWLDKRDLSSIEKARLLGPQLQPNDFAAFMVYGSGPFIGLLACGWQQWRTWPVVLYLLVMARLLLATFSRGGYIGLAAAMAAASFVRGKLFIAGLAALLLGVVATVPEVVPQSLSARMGTIPNDPDAQLDKSSRTRLILWHAALEMTWESPLTGKGFGRFPQLKAFYTEEPVEEKDNHNMFLYIASQMGIPALLAFCFVVWRMLRAGMHVFRRETALFPRSAGLGGVALAAAVVGVNMFGSRMTDVCVMAYVWIYLAALARLEVEGTDAESVNRGEPRP